MTSSPSPALNIQHPYVAARQTNTATVTGRAQTHLPQPAPLSLLLPRLLPLPMRYTPSFGAGCYGDRWHAPSRSSPDRAGNYDIAGSGSGSPSYSQCGSRSTRPGERLRGGEEGSDNADGQNTCTQTDVSVKTQIVLDSAKRGLIVIHLKRTDVLFSLFW